MCLFDMCDIKEKKRMNRGLRQDSNYGSYMWKK